MKKSLFKALKQAILCLLTTLFGIASSLQALGPVPINTLTPGLYGPNIGQELNPVRIPVADRRTMYFESRGRAPLETRDDYLVWNLAPLTPGERVEIAVPDRLKDIIRIQFFNIMQPNQARAIRGQIAPPYTPRHLLTYPAITQQFSGPRGPIYTRPPAYDGTFVFSRDLSNGKLYLIPGSQGKAIEITETAQPNALLGIRVSDLRKPRMTDGVTYPDASQLIKSNISLNYWNAAAAAATATANNNIINTRAAQAILAGPIPMNRQVVQSKVATQEYPVQEYYPDPFLAEEPLYSQDFYQPEEPVYAAPVTQIQPQPAPAQTDASALQNIMNDPVMLQKLLELFRQLKGQ